MTLLLYAVTPADAPVPDDLPALHGARAAVVHTEQEAPPASDRDAVLAFGRIIERIAETGAVLPMRFGSTVADLGELRLLIAQHEEAWASRLEAVAGCDELIVHLDHTPEPDAPPAPTEESGRGYLQRRAEALRSRDAVRDELRAVVRPWSREARILPSAGADRMAMLVPRAEVARVRVELERWATERADLRIAVTGPWPPYSFCEAVT